MGYLFDTNIVGAVLRYDETVLNQMKMVTHQGAKLFISVISTEAEIRRYFPSPQRPLSQRERGRKNNGYGMRSPKTGFGTPCVPRVCRPKTGFPRSHAWECREQRASVAGKGRWRVPTAFPRWRVGTRNYEFLRGPVEMLWIDSLELSKQAAEIHAYLRKKGTPIQDADILIAATALLNDLTVVTDDSDLLRIPN